MKWSKLTALQRNALVCEKVFGWQWIAYNFYDTIACDNQLWLFLPNGEAIAELSPGEWTYYEEDAEGSIVGNRYLAYIIPDYSTSMDAAMDIITSHKFMKVELDYSEGWVDDTTRWQVYSCIVHPYNGEVIGIIANTMNDALCLAALKAVGMEIEP